MLNINAVEQLSLFDLKPRSQSKEIGQFFTESKTADYMASMLHFVGNVELVKILDVGAGEGTIPKIPDSRMRHRQAAECRLIDDTS